MQVFYLKESVLYYFIPMAQFKRECVSSAISLLCFHGRDAKKERKSVKQMAKAQWKVRVNLNLT